MKSRYAFLHYFNLCMYLQMFEKNLYMYAIVKQKLYMYVQIDQQICTCMQ